MTLDDFITTVFCVTDDFMQAVLGGERLRKRGPRPTVPDSVVVTCELVGEFLGYDTDSGIYRYIRRHHLSEFFPWTCFRRWARFTERPLPGKRRTSGRSKNGSRRCFNV
jgi:hypothetical protein